MTQDLYFDILFDFPSKVTFANLKHKIFTLEPKLKMDQTTSYVTGYSDSVNEKINNFDRFFDTFPLEGIKLVEL